MNMNINLSTIVLFTHFKFTSYTVSNWYSVSVQRYFNLPVLGYSPEDKKFSPYGTFDDKSNFTKWNFFLQFLTIDALANTNTN